MIRMRELQSLMRLHHHPFLVSLFEVHHLRDNRVALVFEYMPDGNLHDYIQKHQASGDMISEHAVASITKQVFQALDHLHQRLTIHRDVKPENLCCHICSGSLVVKLSDFSLARGYHEEHAAPLTDYISTRWYRAPEVLLRSITESASISYGVSMDVFAMGCIVAELFLLRPLFPGRDEIDQLQKVTGLLGPLPDRMNKFCSSIVELRHSPSSSSKSPWTRMEEALAGRNNEALSVAAKDFVFRTLALDPSQRLTSKEAIIHNFLRHVPLPNVAPGQSLSRQELASPAMFTTRSPQSPTPMSNRLNVDEKDTAENTAPGRGPISSSKTVHNPYKRIALATPSTLGFSPTPQPLLATPRFRLRIHDNSHLLKVKKK